MTTLDIRVKPGARRESLDIDQNGAITVALRQPPVDGKANEALIRLLAKRLGVPKTAIRVVRGITGRSKLISVPLDSLEQALELLRRE